MARSVTDAATLLSVIAGKDPQDKFTLSQPDTVPDFTRALKSDALKGKRIGVPRRVFLNDSIIQIDPSLMAAFNESLKIMKSLGATIVDPADLPSADEIAVSPSESLVIGVDMKVEFLCNVIINYSLRHSGTTK